MRGFSKVIIAGNLTRDPEVRSTATGTQVTSFSVAINRSYKGTDGSMKDEVSYIECIAWAKLGDTIAQYAKKGNGILVSGRLRQSSWDDKSTGQKRSRVEIIVDDFNFLGSGSRDAGSSASGTSKSGKNEVIPEDIPDDIDGEVSLDDIPF